MDLKEQKYVCTLAECKSLTRASERLYISQPALSLYINNVEKILGARLFERNGRKFELTWLGKQYVEKASQMLELERQFEAVRRQAERENAGQVRIGIAQRRGIWFLPAVLSVYEREWPQVDVVIREGNLRIAEEYLAKAAELAKKSGIPLKELVEVLELIYNGE